MDTATIMIIDEPTRLRDLLASILRMLCYAVLECDGGQAALKRLRHVRPDLVIVEAILPVMSGFQVCATLRRDPILRDLPTLMMCSEKHQLLKGGAWKEHVPADEVIARPFGVQELLVRIAGLLRAEARSG
jgi:two-component system phosphate regulon response regulator PhoB